MKILLLLACIVLFSAIHAQTNIIHMDAAIKTAFNDSISPNGSHIPTKKSKPEILVDLSDTLDISQIQVTLKTQEGGATIISKNFNYTDTGQFLDGTWYERDGNILRFGMGNFTSLLRCFASTRIKYTNGSYSNYVNFSTQ